MARTTPTSKPASKPDPTQAPVVEAPSAPAMVTEAQHPAEPAPTPEPPAEAQPEPTPAPSEAPAPDPVSVADLEAVLVAGGVVDIAPDGAVTTAVEPAAPDKEPAADVEAAAKPPVDEPVLEVPAVGATEYYKVTSYCRYCRGGVVTVWNKGLVIDSLNFDIADVRAQGCPIEPCDASDAVLTPSIGDRSV